MTTSHYLKADSREVHPRPRRPSPPPALDFVEVQTREVSTAALDFLAVTCFRHEQTDAQLLAKIRRGSYSPCHDWRQAGFLIEQDEICPRKIVSVPFSTWEYNERNLARAKASPHGCEVVARQLLVGPGRAVREYLPKHKHDGMWLAKKMTGSDATTRWSIEDDFLSPTATIAVTRCFVVSRLGEHALVPRELLRPEELERWAPAPAAEGDAEEDGAGADAPRP